ncbi:MAG: hypothetical protein AB1632_04310 [Nitrospirota bacterium]
MKKILMPAGLILYILLTVQPGFSHTTDEIKVIKDDIKSLREGQKAIQKELQELRDLLKSKQAARPAEFKEAIINIEGAHFKGDKNAKLAIIEFSDYQ